MTYFVAGDPVDGGFIVVQDDGSGTLNVIARCGNSTAAYLVADALNA